jgi:hypothetical protein
MSMKKIVHPIALGWLVLLACAAGCGDKKEAQKAPAAKKASLASSALDLDTPLRVVGKVLKTSKIPDPETLDYDDLITTVKFAVEKVEKGRYDKKEILVELLAIRSRKPLPAAALKAGMRVELYLLPWKDTAESIKSLQQVDDVGDYQLTPYFAAGHVVLGIKPESSTAAVKADRDKAVAETRAALEAEVEKYGDGSYDKWLASLKDFYEDMKRQGEAITKETARKGEFGPYKKNNLSVYKSLYEHPALPQIVDFAKALAERNIDLIYLSIPRPQLVYPDYIADVALPHNMVVPRYREQLKYLVDHDVEVIDTVPFIMAHREEPLGRMYTIKSHHPTNAFMRRFAEMAAERIKRYGLTNGRFEVFAEKEAAPDHGTEVKQVIFPDGQPYTDAGRQHDPSQLALQERRVLRAPLQAHRPPRQDGAAQLLRPLGPRQGIRGSHGRGEGRGLGSVEPLPRQTPRPGQLVEDAHRLVQDPRAGIVSGGNPSPRIKCQKQRRRLPKG